MKLRLKIALALLAAFAIEALNFWFVTVPIDVDGPYPQGTPWYIPPIDFQWVMLHLPGLRSIDWFACFGLQTTECSYGLLAG